MSVYVNNKFRVKRNMLQQEEMKKITDAHILPGYKDILVVSALIGYENNLFEPIEKPAADGVLMQFFTETDYDIMDFLAYARTKNQSIIRTDEKYEVFSSYANAGFPILLEKLGIGNMDEISEEESRSFLLKYYKLLLKNGFSINSKVEDEELFI